MTASTPTTHPASRGQGRQLLLEAAREVFADKGFAGAGVREIAARAGVTEPTVYWHFKSKRGLFEAAVSEPFAVFFRDFFGAWRQREPGRRPAVDEAIDYLSGLFDVLHAERELIIAMLADSEFTRDGNGMRVLQETVAELLTLHEQSLRPETTERGFRDIDLTVWTRLFFSTVFTIAVFGPLLDPRGEIEKDRYIRQFAEMAIYGAQPRTGPRTHEDDPR